MAEKSLMKGNEALAEAAIRADVYKRQVLMHEPTWDDALDEIVNELAMDNVKRFKFRRNGAATPGHPRIPEQTEMADELYGFITGWEN